MLWLKLAISVVLSVANLQLAYQSEYTNGYYEGDIILTNEHRRTLEVLSNPSDPFAPQNAVVRNEEQLWPNGMVPYVLNSSLSDKARLAIQDAIAEYHRLTCVRFVPRTTEEDYVIIFLGYGCYSYVGRITGPQYMSIGYGCEYKGTVIHEMFHALGRWHEQSRPDRNLHVRILTENIINGTQYNFEIKDQASVSTQGVPYDIGSIMHYRFNAFTNNGNPTILPLDTSIDKEQLGQRDGLSDMDLQHVQMLYCGGGGSHTSWSLWTSWSSCSQTCNGGSRTRSRYCNGGTACKGSNIQSRICNTGSCPEPVSWGSWNAWSGCSNTCGRGRRTRTRSCDGGNNCMGSRTSFQNCFAEDCPQPATWASWGSWSSCSSTCQGGTQQRRRICRNGNNCPGVDVEIIYCNMRIPCETTSPSEEWSSWSKCSAGCGGGSRYRVRNCESSSTNCQTETRSCNTEDCVPEPEIRGVRYRGCWYLNAGARKIGSLEGSTPDLSDDASKRDRPVSKCGTAVESSGYEFFGVSTGYCFSGSNNLRDYQYIATDLCKDGKGAYSRENGGWFIMSVYQITNQASFSDSVILLNTPNVTNDVDDMMATERGSGLVLTYNFALLVSSFLTVILVMAAM